MKKETKMMGNYIGKFDENKSYAVKKLKQMYSDNITKNELNQIITLARSKDGSIPEIPRPAKRTIKALFKWCDTNWEIIYPIIQNIHLEDENKVEISQETYNKINSKMF